MILTLGLMAFSRQTGFFPTRPDQITQSFGRKRLFMPGNWCFYWQNNVNRALCKSPVSQTPR
jgi:hypothetical protein